MNQPQNNDNKIIYINVKSSRININTGGNLEDVRMVFDATGSYIIISGCEVLERYKSGMPMITSQECIPPDVDNAKRLAVKLNDFLYRAKKWEAQGKHVTPGRPTEEELNKALRDRLIRKHRFEYNKLVFKYQCLVALKNKKHTDDVAADTVESMATDALKANVTSFLNNKDLHLDDIDRSRATSTNFEHYFFDHLASGEAE